MKRIFLDQEDLLQAGDDALKAKFFAAHELLDLDDINKDTLSIIQERV